MKSLLELSLAPGAPPALTAALQRVPGAILRLNEQPSSLRLDGRRWRLRLLPRPLVDDPAVAAQIAERDARAEGDDVLPLVYAPTLPRLLRAAYEARNISYVDGRGAVHLVAPGLLVHLDPAPRRPEHPSMRPAGIGVVGIRAAQALATEPEREWTVADLATVADVSTGEAHKVLTALQSAGLVEAQGRGPRRRRRVHDLGSLLDWLAAQPRARRVYTQLSASLYARTPQDLAVRATRALDAAGIVHAATGALAAVLLQAGPSAVPRAVLRIHPDTPLDQAVEVLGAEVTERGPNLVLWSDTGRVGTHGRTQCDGTWLALPVRIYLDLLSERRGEDVAAHFRDMVLQA